MYCILTSVTTTNVYGKLYETDHLNSGMVLILSRCGNSDTVKVRKCLIIKVCRP